MLLIHANLTVKGLFHELPHLKSAANLRLKQPAFPFLQAAARRFSQEPPSPQLTEKDLEERVSELNQSLDILQQALACSVEKEKQLLNDQKNLLKRIEEVHRKHQKLVPRSASQQDPSDTYERRLPLHLSRGRLETTTIALRYYLNQYLENGSCVSLLHTYIHSVSEELADLKKLTAERLYQDLTSHKKE